MANLKNDRSWKKEILFKKFERANVNRQALRLTQGDFWTISSLYFKRNSLNG